MRSIWEYFCIRKNVISTARKCRLKRLIKLNKLWRLSLSLALRHQTQQRGRNIWCKSPFLQFLASSSAKHYQNGKICTLRSLLFIFSRYISQFSWIAIIGRLTCYVTSKRRNFLPTSVNSSDMMCMCIRLVWLYALSKPIFTCNEKLNSKLQMEKVLYFISLFANFLHTLNPWFSDIFRGMEIHIFVRLPVITLLAICAKNKPLRN